jgi:hypothetical protein
MAKRRCSIQLRNIAKHLTDARSICSIRRACPQRSTLPAQGRLSAGVRQVCRRKSCRVPIWHRGCSVRARMQFATATGPDGDRGKRQTILVVTGEYDLTGRPRAANTAKENNRRHRRQRQRPGNNAEQSRTSTSDFTSAQSWRFPWPDFPESLPPSSGGQDRSNCFSWTWTAR